MKSLFLTLVTIYLIVGVVSGIHNQTVKRAAWEATKMRIDMLSAGKKDATRFRLP